MPHTLLAADDSATIRRVIELTFADLDVAVVTVGDGDQALASLDAAPPDIVLADILMPGRSGYEVARHVRDTPRLSHIPVLLLAGAFEPVDHSMAASLGCAGILTKPLDPQLVIRRVSELLAARTEAVNVQDEPEARVPSTPMTPAPVPEAPRDAEPSGDALSAARPVVPAAAPTTAEEGARPAPGGRDVDAYFEELDQRLTSVTRDEYPVLHAVESRSALSEEEVVSRASAPSAVVTASDASDPVAPRPSLAEAFSALLAAEQTTPRRPGALVRPVFDSHLAPMSEDVLERVARRALDRLSQDAVREMVERVVSETAERLIREEIERIKSNIK